MRRGLLALAAVLALVAGAFLLLRGDGGPTGDAIERKSSGSQSRTPGRSRPRPAFDDASEARDRDHVAEPEPVAEVRTAPTPAAQPKAILRVEIDGLEPSIPAAPNSVTVVRTKQVDAGPTKLAAAATSEGRSADVDVTVLLPDRAERGEYAEVTVLVRRTGYLDAATTEWLHPSRARGTEPLRFATRVKLVAAGIVTGIVQDDRFQRVGGAQVGAFVETRGSWTRVSRSVTDPSGEFRLYLQPGVANLIAVAADGLTPGFSQATGVALAETALAPFTLREGLSIAGTARFADGTVIPEARVVARPTWAETNVVLPPHLLAFRGGGIFECPAAAPVNTDLFRIAGLVPGDYDVTVSAPRISSDVLKAAAQRVTAPAERVRFAIGGGHVVVETTYDGRRVPGVLVSVTNDKDGVSDTTTRDEGVRLLVMPGAQYTVSTGRTGFDAEKRSVQGPAAGTEARLTIPLRGLPPKLRLKMGEAAPGPEPFPRVEVKLFYDEGPPSELPEQSEFVDLSRGEYVIGGPWPGPFRVVARPDATRGFWLPARATVALRAGVETPVELTFPLGGRIAVRAHGPDGTPAPARYEVRRNDELVASGDTGPSSEAVLPAAVYAVGITGADGTRVVSTIRVEAEKVAVVDVELPSR